MKPSKLMKALNVCIQARRPAMVWGSPGVGKSGIMAWLCTQREGWEFLDFRLVIRDAVDMRGVPFVDTDGRTRWAVPAEFPKPGTKGIWFLDEINAAHPQVQAVAYQLVLDRAVGEYKMPDGWVVMAAGNYESDGAVTHKMPSALRSRFIHLDLEPDLDEWVPWADKNGIHESVTGWVRFRPEMIHSFKKETAKTARTFSCPRTLEFLSDIVKMNPPEDVELELYQGTVGENEGSDYAAFVKYYRQLPDLDLILTEPKKAPLPNPDQLEVSYAVACALARRATPQNFANVLIYLNRMDVEFNVMAVKDAVNRLANTKDDLAAHPKSAKYFTEWSHQHADVTLGAN